MSDNRFPILGTTTPQMLGRTSLIDKMVRALTKTTPDHIQVVGPRFSGKTVLLNELVNRQEIETSYSAILYWDLGHQTPETDELFMSNFADELSSALKTKHPDCSEHLKSDDRSPYQDIAEILDLLKLESIKLLVILDGFDKPLENGQLTRNLWDQLRELALKSSLRLVTASRRRLSDLIRDPDAKTSDFWGIFDPNPIRIGCFTDEEISKILESLDEYTFDVGAITEIKNSSNGYPVLFFSILNCICNVHSCGKISAENIQMIIDDAYLNSHDNLSVLWDDCAPTSKDLLLRVIEEGETDKTGISPLDIETMIERGFLNSSGNKINKPNRLIVKYLQEQPNEGNALARLFNDNKFYFKNLVNVLERRINQIENINPDLRQFLVLGLGQLPEHPGVFLASSMHGILEQVLTLIWKAECWDANKNKAVIPQEWFDIWHRNEERDKKIDDWKTRFPEGGARLRLLDLITGTQKTDRLAKHVTKNTYVLVNSLQSFRDFGVHPKGTDIYIQTAIAALTVSIELTSCLTDELSNAI